MNGSALAPAPTPSSARQLLELPYFDMLACFGHYSLHPGGLNATAMVLAAAELQMNDAVLEVGCGTGATTSALLAVGLDVSVAEPNPLMVRAALANCERSVGKMPRVYATCAEELRGVPAHSQDMALFEAVFGFLNDRHAALSSCKRVLRTMRGRIGVVDFHYVQPPPAALRRELASVIGAELPVLFERDWRELLEDWHVTFWETAPLGSIPAPARGDIRTKLSANAFAPQLAEVTEDDLERIVGRLQRCNAVFEENRHYMRAHHIVARVPWH